MSDSEGPGLSDAFHVGTSPQSMREAIIALARVQQHYRTLSKVHWQQIVELRTAIETHSITIISLTQRIASLETKLAIYVGLGSTLGGALISVIMRLIFK
jgi:flavin-binding protein dodecin